MISLRTFATWLRKYLGWDHLFGPCDQRTWQIQLYRKLTSCSTVHKVTLKIALNVIRTISSYVKFDLNDNVMYWMYLTERH